MRPRTHLGASPNASSVTLGGLLGDESPIGTSTLVLTRGEDERYGRRRRA